MEFIKQHKKAILIILCILILIAVIVCSYIEYYLYQQSKIDIKSERTFYIETEEQDLSQIANDWINQYVGQYMQKYVPRLKKVNSIEIKNVEVLDEENQYVQIDFDLKTTKKESNYFLENDWGIYEENHTLSCQWVLKFLLREENQISKYFISNRMRPVEDRKSVV